MADELNHISVSIPFAKITPVENTNPDEFTRVKIWVFAAGKNRNMSYVSKEELDKAIPSVYYVPVVGHLIEETDKDGNVVGHYFGGHDMALTDDMQLKSITVPYGVVIQDTAKYETVSEYGKDVEYLTAEAYLWTSRYPEATDAIYSDDVWFGQSCELSYTNFRPLEEDSNYTELLGVNFSALCILGKSDDPTKHTEPCFISARIEPVQFNLDDSNFSKLMGEMKDSLARCFNKENSEKGGNDVLTEEMINSIFAGYEDITRDEIDFEITDDMTEDQLKAALDAFACKKKVKCEEGGSDDDDGSGTGEGTGAGDTDADPEPVPVVDDDKAKKKQNNSLFSATMNEKREALRKAMPNICNRDDEGCCIEEISYYVEDFDDTYVYVEKDHWAKHVNYEYKYGRIKYSFDDTTMVATLSGEFEEMVSKWLTLEEAAQIDKDRNELESLRTFKKDTETSAFNAQVDSVLADFDDLNDVEGFGEIKDKAYECESVDALKMQLFALRGMQVQTKKADKKSEQIKFSIDTEKATTDPYGGLFEKFGVKPNKK